LFRAELIKLLVGEYDLLLLDEPTNFLDLESREKFEEALLGFEGAVIVVSHDRYLLDRVCGTTWHLKDGKLTVYPGNFSQYRAAQSVKKEETKLGEEDKARLELRLAQLDGELCKLDRARDEAEYLALEAEYYRIAKTIREL
jgi:ATPase subunit of ABC transporter with duplicated ATPase domains